MKSRISRCRNGVTAMSDRIIAVDFDGTLCENAWPEIGEPVEPVLKYVRYQQFTGAKIILWTCRVGDKLDAAVAWCSEHGLIFDAVNENLPEIVKAFGGDCRKIYADEYIDDKNVLPDELVNQKKRISGRALRNKINL